MDKRGAFKDTLLYLRLADALIFMALLGIFVYIVLVLPQISDRIPLYFRFNGEIARFTEKTRIWLLPSVFTFLYVGLSVISNLPEILKVFLKNYYKNPDCIKNVIYSEMIYYKLIIVSLNWVITVSIANSLALKNWFFTYIVALLIVGLISGIILLLKCGNPYKGSRRLNEKDS